MPSHHHVVRRLTLPLCLLAAAAACGDATAPEARRVSLSFAARGATSHGGSGVTQGSTGTVVVAGGDTLRLTSVRLVVDELELERGLAGTCGDDDADAVITVDAGCAELELGPYLVALPMNGSLTPAVTVSLPVGSYRGLEMKLRRADSGDDRAFNARHPEMNGITVRVEGTFRGQPFTWRGDVEADLELDFDPPLVVDGAGNFTVDIDAGRWFRTSAGAIIDPATAGPGQPNFGLVAQNIRASFAVYEDDDRDGNDDSRQDDRGGRNS